MYITAHAKKRMRQRCGYKARTAEKMARRAWAKGIHHSDTCDSIKRYFDMLYLSHRNANNIRQYGDKAYLFKGETLITVIQIPMEIYRGND